jgi:hypothetical protein
MSSTGDNAQNNNRLGEAITLLNQGEWHEVIRILKSETGPTSSWIRGIAFKNIGFKADSHGEAVFSYQKATEAFKQEARAYPNRFIELAGNMVSRSWALPAYLAKLQELQHTRNLIGPLRLLQTVGETGSSASPALHTLEMYCLNYSEHDILTQGIHGRAKNAIRRITETNGGGLNDPNPDPIRDRLHAALWNHDTAQESYSTELYHDWDLPIPDHVERLRSTNYISVAISLGVIGARERFTPETISHLQRNLKSGRASCRSLALFGICEQIRQGNTPEGFFDGLLPTITEIVKSDRSYLVRKSAIEELGSTIQNSIKPWDLQQKTRAMEILKIG